MSSVNLHIYPTPITHESRMLKETRSIAEAGLVDQIYLVGMEKAGLPEHEQIDDKRQIWRIRPKIGSQESGLVAKTIRYIEWQGKIFLAFRSRGVKFVNCHSLPVLPVGLAFKLFSHSKLVYDTHELETESDGAVGIKRMLYKLVEKSMIRFADVVITVNQSIAEWYRKEYGLKNVYAVRNVPYQQNGGEIAKSNVLRSKFGIGDDQVLFVFQGGLNPGRGIEIFLDAFANIDRQKQVVFMGFGPLQPLIEKYEQVHPNIHLHNAVPPDQVHIYTSSADVGLCLQENVGLNYYLSLPNKLFEYIMSGLAVVVSDFPEMARVVDEAGCGWKVPVDRDAVFSLIERISWEEIVAKRARALDYRVKMGWHEEEKVLLQAYRSLSERQSYKHS